MREMNETKRGIRSHPICGFSINLKSISPRQKIVSPKDMDVKRDRALLAWSVRWVLNVRLRGKDKSVHVKGRCDVAMATSEGKTFVLYRRQMIRLLRFPKPVFDQLALELPMLMGFRAAEVTTWRAEYIDFAVGDTLVLDAKKKALFSVPLATTVARHAEEALNGRSKGLVLRSRSYAQQDPTRPLTTTTIWNIWRKWTRKAGLPDALHISPVVGRRFFAAEWYHSQELSLVTLQKILRHARPMTTLHYVQSLVFYKDVKRDYDRFQLGLMQEIAPCQK